MPRSLTCSRLLICLTKSSLGALTSPRRHSTSQRRSVSSNHFSLFAWAVRPNRDPKLRVLFATLARRLRAHEERPRVLVFTKYKDTLDYLVENLTKPSTSLIPTDWPDGVEVFNIHGGLNLAQRSEVFAAFESSPLAVLVATDCISEGLNLQAACAELIHYELPWNPNRLEQRNGRIDRFGSASPLSEYELSYTTNRSMRPSWS